ncbi:MAG: PKD domain-containing protein [Gammaproteobacteria bacterium]|nr:MAG: PKD domain-containing protein [Gammaproteobacteria bacterium]
MKKVILMISLVMTFFISTAVHAVDNSEMVMKRSSIAKQYKQLKQKADYGGKVRVIVKYKSDSAEPGAIKKLSKKQAFDKAHTKALSKGFPAIKKLKNARVAVYKLDSQELDQLIDSGLVESVYEDVADSPMLQESIPFIGADIAHQNGFIGTGQSIVILDSGVNSEHSFFEDRIVDEACFSTNDRSENATSLCPDGGEEQFGVGAGMACDSESRFVSKKCTHGTHVAGIAAGYYDEEFTGVAYGSNIISIQVFSLFDNHDERCDGREQCIKTFRSDQVEALAWILNNHADYDIAAINMSIGDESERTRHCDNDPRRFYIERLRAEGIATVISSGNDGHSNAVGAPGCISSAITVGSVLKSSDEISMHYDDDGELEWGSNGGELVDILAPGSRIKSSTEIMYYDNLDPIPWYAYKSGTSMAAPHVAGAVAVLKTINPEASVDEIERVLEESGVSVLDTRNDLTFPRLDLNAAVVSFINKPIAQIDNESYSVMVNQNLELSAYSSSDPNNASLLYTWDFGDGLVDYQTAAPSVTHAYSAMGTYEVGLFVDNGNNVSDLDTAQITVYDPAIISVIISSVLF